MPRNDRKIKTVKFFFFFLFLFVKYRFKTLQSISFYAKSKLWSGQLSLKLETPAYDVYRLLPMFDGICR